MQMPTNYSTTDAEEERMPQPIAGGYILYCLKTEETQSKAGNEMIVFDFEIMEGEFKKYYTRLVEKHKDKFKRWPLQYFQLVTEEQIGRYKGLVDSFKKSNTNFPADSFGETQHDTGKFQGLKIGAVMRVEEYEKANGSIGSTLKIFYLTSAERITKGDFKIPEPKTVEVVDQPPAQNNSANQDDLPF